MTSRASSASPGLVTRLGPAPDCRLGVPRWLQHVGAAAEAPRDPAAPAGLREEPRAARALSPRGARAGPRLQLPRECARGAGLRGVTSLPARLGLVRESN